MTSSSDGVSAHPPLTGGLWFGTAGVALVLGGIVALLAANWHTVPFGIQIFLALLPLILSWGLYGLKLRRGTDTPATNQILGTLWAGAVIAAVALLGRILQLGSDAFAFCATVTLLLLPVVYATQATAAWLTAWGFTLASAMAWHQSSRGPHSAGIAIAILLCGLLLNLPAILNYWRTDSLYATSQRLPAALMAVITSGLMMRLSYDWFDEASFPAVSLCAVLPLLIGLFIRRRTPCGRELTLCGILMPSVILIAAQSDAGFVSPLWWAIACPLLFVPAGRRLLHGEGLFLLIVPVTAVTCYVGSSVLQNLGALTVGIVILTCGLQTGRRAVANEGLILTLLTAWIGFANWGADLMIQGILLILGGIALVAVNLLLSRFAKGGRHA